MRISEVKYKNKLVVEKEEQEKMSQKLAGEFIKNTINIGKFIY
jgi:hypothetical protein